MVGCWVLLGVLACWSNKLVCLFNQKERLQSHDDFSTHNMSATSDTVILSCSIRGYSDAGQKYDVILDICWKLFIILH